MRSMLLVTLCVLSFASVSFSALVFGDRFGSIPLGQEELTAFAYTLQTNEHQVGLYLDSQHILVEGTNFFTVILGSQTRLLSPGETDILHHGEQIAVMGILAENITKEHIWAVVSQISSLELLIHNLSRLRNEVFVFGFNIATSSFPEAQLSPPPLQLSLPVIQLSPTNHWSRGHKRPYDDGGVSPVLKRVRLVDLVIQDRRFYCNYANTRIDQDDTCVNIEVNFGTYTASASAKLTGRGMTLTCKGGANILVLHDGQVQEGSIMPAKENFPDFDFNQETVTLMSSYDEMTRSVEALYGDVVVILVPYSNDSNNQLVTLAGAQQLLGNPKDALANFDKFSAKFCGDKVIAFVFVVKPRKQDDY
ncbi:hypothetical protein PSACC_00138 [Paramicrosporidium saccamoebae]|uniref:Uncharacterized protein n=1 Tax=Paramicrosporidium saccamoebae TaxID=1246581 RepID=A0A2H9TQT6_9FUNG|nr:hypothetical protein PSACC_00138 [Paramicrosporidium saccamoebae]